MDNYTNKVMGSSSILFRQTSIRNGFKGRGESDEESNPSSTSNHDGPMGYATDDKSPHVREFRFCKYFQHAN